MFYLQVSLGETFCIRTAVCLKHFNMMHPSAPSPMLPGCSRHLLLAVGLVDWAGGHYGLLEALHTSLHGAAHVPAYHIGTPVPEERGRIKQKLQYTCTCKDLQEIFRRKLRNTLLSTLLGKFLAIWITSQMSLFTELSPKGFFPSLLPYGYFSLSGEKLQMH